MITTKIYLAARYSRHQEMQGVRDILEALGHKVTARWIDLHADTGEQYEHSFSHRELNGAPEVCSFIGQRDLEDIEECEWLLAFSEPAGSTGSKGGRHVELGYALAKEKRVTIIGQRENVFHTLPGVEWYPTWSRFVMSLGYTIHDTKDGSGVYRQRTEVDNSGD